MTLLIANLEDPDKAVSFSFVLYLDMVHVKL